MLFSSFSCIVQLMLGRHQQDCQENRTERRVINDKLPTIDNRST